MAFFTFFFSGTEKLAVKSDKSKKKVPKITTNPGRGKNYREKYLKKLQLNLHQISGSGYALTINTADMTSIKKMAQPQNRYGNYALSILFVNAVC
jgi:hypothetical protein